MVNSLRIEVTCNHCHREVSAPFDSVGTQQFLLEIHRGGWAFYTFDLALCPNCVAGWKSGVIRDSKYRKLFETADF